MSFAIEPTNICNLKCGMCYAQTSKREQGMMSYDLYQKIIDEVVTLKIDCIGLNYGGEPTVHPLFANMIKYASDKDQHVQFSTNGILLTEDITNAIVSGYVRKVNFSLHTYLDIVEENIIKIRGERTNRKPQLTATINASEFDDTTTDKLLKRFSYLVDQIGIQPTIANMKWSKIPKKIKINYQKYCRQSQRYTAVLWDGKITICCHDIGGEMAFGDVYNNSLTEIWNSDYYINLRKNILKSNFPKGSLCERCGIGRTVISYM